MHEYLVSLDGCDDSTRIRIHLTDDEVKCLRRISKASEVISTYGCMPTMSVTRIENADTYDLDYAVVYDG